MVVWAGWGGGDGGWVEGEVGGGDMGRGGGWVLTVGLVGLCKGRMGMVRGAT